MLGVATTGGLILASTVPIMGSLIAFSICGIMYGYLKATRFPVLMIPVLLAISYLPIYPLLKGVEQLEEFQTFLMALTAMHLVLFGTLYSLGLSIPKDEDIE